MSFWWDSTFPSLNSISLVSFMRAHTQHEHTNSGAALSSFWWVARQVMWWLLGGVQRCKWDALVSLTTCSWREAVGREIEFERGETVPTGDRGVLRPNALWSEAQVISRGQFGGSIMHYTARLSHTACQCTGEQCCCSKYELNIGLL